MTALLVLAKLAILYDTKTTESIVTHSANVKITKVFSSNTLILTEHSRLIHLLTVQLFHNTPGGHIIPYFDQPSCSQNINMIASCIVA